MIINKININKLQLNISAFTTGPLFIAIYQRASNCFTTNISAASIPSTLNPTVGGGTITACLSAVAMTCRLQS